MWIKLNKGTDRHKPGSLHDVAAIVPRVAGGGYQFILYDGSIICETTVDFFVNGYGRLTLSGHTQAVEKELEPCVS